MFRVEKRCRLEIVVHALDSALPGSQPVEVVERKGIGHPDTICDALAEQVCVHLSREYLDRFGVILHHNVDKILLCGGSSRPAFGGGEICEPIVLYLGGRATAEFRGERIPVADIAVDACRKWLQSNFPALDEARSVTIVPRFRPGSGDLTNLFRRGATAGTLCNDTSCGVGFAPFTPLENAVLETERALNSEATQAQYPALGRDIKVMGVRHESRIDLTVACAMIGRHLPSLAAYAEAKEIVRQLSMQAAARFIDGDMHVTVNAADDLLRGEVYLTVTGTSAESGDDGEVGRGNRTTGLITPYRPMSLEAAAGKNPVSHVGKLYNLAAASIAQRAQQIPGVRSADCVLVSQIGRRIEDPLVADLAVYLTPGTRLQDVKPKLRDLTRDELSEIPRIQVDLLAERVRLY